VQDLGQSTLILANPVPPEAANSGRDLRLRRREAQFARLEILDACQDQFRLVPMELPDLQRDHATLTVREHTEGKDRLHAKGGSGLESLALAYEQGVVDMTLRGVFFY
jgi:hypothetical protein